MNRINFVKNRAFHWISLGLCLFTFGVLIPWLGFYWDDWLVIFNLQAGRLADLATLYSYDRPFSVWTAWVFGPVLGVRPAVWHIFTLMVRWLTVLAMWWALRVLWPRQKRLWAWAALLFAVYPSFFLQSISVAYSQHWLAYLLFFVSLAAMGKAVLEEEHRWRWSLLALAAALLHSITLEYFAGLELIRPLYLWLLFDEERESLVSTAKRILRHWLPYLLLWSSFVVWRLFFLELPVDPHRPELLLALRLAPLAAGLEFARTAVLSVWHMLGGVWLALLTSDFSSINLVALLVGVFAGGGIWFAAEHLERREDARDDEVGAGFGAWVFGLVAIVLGLLPAFLIQESVHLGGYNQRFTLPAMFGASIIWVLVLNFVKKKSFQRLALSILIAVAAVGHVSAGQEFVEDWEQQQRFYQQLAWRAPRIEADTALISFLRLSPNMQNSSLSVAVNTLYEQSQADTHMDYWNFDIRLTRNVEPLRAADSLGFEYRGMLFEAEDSSSVLFWYLPVNGCLWLLGPLHVNNEYVPSDERDLVALSNLDQVTEQPGNNLDSVIFDGGETTGWCYYFENADLAAQMGEWQEVINLMEEAESREVEPEVDIEWLPLLRAYAHTEHWREAEELSRQMMGMGGRGLGLLCAQWLEFINSGEVSVPVESRVLIIDLAACEF